MSRTKKHGSTKPLAEILCAAFDEVEKRMMNDSGERFPSPITVSCAATAVIGCLAKYIDARMKEWNACRPAKCDRKGKAARK